MAFELFKHGSKSTPKEATHCGRKICFHGAFATKDAAMKRESERSGRWIEERTVRGRSRFVVMSERVR